MADISRTCPQVQPWLYGYDAIKEVDDAVRNDAAFSESLKAYGRPRVSRLRSDR
jgi:hypothetical protein